MPIAPGASVSYTTPFDDLPLAAFTPDGGSIIYIPVEEAETDGKGRDKVHTFPHSPGGLPEKLGVDLYLITIKAKFDHGFERLYPGNYPDAIDTLEQAFEAQVTGALLLPTWKKSKRAYCTNWKRTFKSKLRSGEEVHLTFREDQTVDAKFSQSKVFSIGSANSTLQSFDDLEDPAALGLFQAINLLVGDITSLQDTIDSYGMLVTAKIDRLAMYCSQMDSLVTDLEHPSNWQITDALHDVWYAAIQLKADVQNTGVQLQFYIVPNLMTIAQVSLAIFGDSTHADDIMALNQIDDLYNIPAPTKIAYYDPNGS